MRFKYKSKIHIEPTKLDTEKLAFDETHINKEREHKITREEAISFIENVKISITKWSGEFENFYSENGAAYVNLTKK